MMWTWELPVSIGINGKQYGIRSDYRAILDILKAFDDDVLNYTEKAIVTIRIFYKDWSQIPIDNLQEAYDKALEFIDFIGGEKKSNPVKIMDWQQDASLIIPAMNKIAGKEIRSIPYMHWWTFLGLYMEIGDCLYSQVLNIRQKKYKGKKLEKMEQEFYKNNRSIIDLKNKQKERSAEEQNALRNLFGIPEKR